jgi:hypothetical protein
MKWYLIVVFICIILLANDGEACFHVLICLLYSYTIYIYIYIFIYVSIQIFCLFFNWVVLLGKHSTTELHPSPGSFYYWFFMYSLHILDNSPILDI